MADQCLYGYEPFDRAAASWSSTGGRSSNWLIRTMITNIVNVRGNTHSASQHSISRKPQNHSKEALKDLQNLSIKASMINTCCFQENGKENLDEGSCPCLKCDIEETIREIQNLPFHQKDLYRRVETLAQLSWRTDKGWHFWSTTDRIRSSLEMPSIQPPNQWLTIV